MGLGRAAVSSLKRVPRPPARITAFICYSINFYSGADDTNASEKKQLSGNPADNRLILAPRIIASDPHANTTVRFRSGFLKRKIFCTYPISPAQSSAGLDKTGTYFKASVIAGTSKYKSCKGTYSLNCVAKPIETVQACLGLAPDGKFGPKTLEAVKAKGFTSFTDADINKICGKEQTKVEPEVSGEDVTINTMDANF